MSATILRLGDSGPAVVELQEHLVRWGYPIATDGLFGSNTETAVMAFQGSEGLTVDGIAGPATMAALESGPATIDEDARFRAAAYAIADLGKAESPLGSQGGPEIAHLVEGYNEYWQIDGPRPAWCGLAVCVQTARALGLGESGAVVDWTRHPFERWRGSTVSSNPLDFSILLWAEENGRLLPPDGPAPLGSIFLMYRAGSGSDDSDSADAGHCGIVLEDLGDEVISADGNVEDGYRRVTRGKAGLIGYVTWYG